MGTAQRATRPASGRARAVTMGAALQREDHAVVGTVERGLRLAGQHVRAHVSDHETLAVKALALPGERLVVEVKRDLAIEEVSLGDHEIGPACEVEETVAPGGVARVADYPPAITRLAARTRACRAAQPRAR